MSSEFTLPDGYVLELGDDNSTHVISSKGKNYKVILESNTCSCPDASYRKSYCKHLKMVAEHFKVVSEPKSFATDEAVEKLLPFIEKIKPHVSTWSFAGTVRRGMPSSKEIDIVIIPSFGSSNFVFNLKSIVHEDSGIEIFTQSPLLLKLVVYLMQVNIIITDEREYAFRLLSETGPKIFFTKLQSTAARAGKILNSRGMTTMSGDTVICLTEEDIFKEIGMEFVNPLNRN